VAIWDRTRRTLLLARDRVGIGPLYYAEHDGWLLWASEVKGILASGLINPVPDPRGLDHVFNFFCLPLETNLLSRHPADRARQVSCAPAMAALRCINTGTSTSQTPALNESLPTPMKPPRARGTSPRRCPPSPD